MWRFLLIVVLLIPSISAAQEHQYQFTQIDTKALTLKVGYISGIIIDQKTGDMWEYIDQPPFGPLAAVHGVSFLGTLRTGAGGERIIGNYGR